MGWYIHHDPSDTMGRHGTWCKRLSCTAYFATCNFLQIGYCTYPQTVYNGGTNNERDYLMTTPSTHTGTCQACGRRQAVHINTGNIAKHGYTTDYGFFNGTCGGSDELPLELDTAVNIRTVAAMIKFAAEQEAAAEAEIDTVLVEVGPYIFDRTRRRVGMR